MTPKLAEAARAATFRAISAGQWLKARALLDSSPPRQRSDPDYWRLELRLAVAQGNGERIKKVAQEVLDHGPRDPRLQLEVGLLCMRLGARGTARDAATRAGASLATDDPHMLDAVGSLMIHLGLEAQGSELLRRAVALPDASPEILYNLASGERMLGNLQAAHDLLDRLLLAKPDHAPAHHMRSGIRRQTKTHNHINVLRSAAQRASANPLTRSTLLFALGKELEDIGNFPASFDAISEACRTRRGHMRYEVAADVEAIENITDQFKAAALQPVGGHVAAATPIFVLGLPRSGTTLVERMLDGHSAVTGAGELQFFPGAVVEGVQKIGGGAVSKIGFAKWSLQVEPDWLAQRYLEQADPQRTPFFVDKLPLNYLYIGLIRRALPNSKIVLLDRHPVDTCYAMYKTLFEEAYPFSYNLDDLAAYYLAYARLVEHWQSLLGDAIHVVSYEALVTDTDRELRRLLDYLGLPWEQNCLNFYERTDAISTASSTQVREPVHTRSVGSWQRYAEQLQPLVELLRQGGVAV